MADFPFALRDAGPVDHGDEVAAQVVAVQHPAVVELTPGGPGLVEGVDVVAEVVGRPLAVGEQAGQARRGLGGVRVGALPGPNRLAVTVDGHQLDQLERDAPQPLLGRPVGLADLVLPGEVDLPGEVLVGRVVEDRGCLAHVEIDYLTEVMYPGEVQLGAGVQRVGRTSIEFRAGLFQHGRRVAVSRSVDVNTVVVRPIGQPN